MASTRKTTARKILALGDSLTEGYYYEGTSFHPYSLKLEQTLGTAYTVREQGVSGETSQQILERLTQPPLCKTIRFYRLVCILAGTNDVGEEKAETIVANLTQMHQYCLKQSERMHTVAIAIPAMKAEARNPYITYNRCTVNERLKALAEATPRMHYFDLASLIPCDDEHEEYWDDGLHFTPSGYDYWGTKLGEWITQHQSALELEH